MIESCDTVIPERRNPSSSNRLGQWVVLSSAGGRLSVAVNLVTDLIGHCRGRRRWTSRTAAPRSRTPPRAAVRIQRADAGEAGLAKLIRAISAVLKYRRVWP